MRICHVTDIHWMVPPGLLKFWYGKRLLGTANLFLLGRRWEFHHDIQRGLVQYLLHLDPDMVIITGDLTAQALPAEFALAREDLAPLLDRTTTFIVPGNHDLYTRGALKTRRIEQYFGDWMWLDRHRPIARLDQGDVTVLGLDPNRPAIDASGHLPQAQLDGLEELLNDPALSTRFIILALHYPIIGPGGEPYDKRGHGLRNARALLDLFDRTKAVPQLVLHGHKHRGYRGAITTRDGRTIQVHNPGASGLAYHPKERRAAAVNAYVVEDGQLARMERHLSDGRTFKLEDGGPYHTGW